MSQVSHRRRGFTLVELLVVIFIIGLLAALLLPAIATAIRMSQNTAMASEISGLKQAVEAYKQARGDYPPNFSEGDYAQPAAANSYVLRHLRLVFPKMNPSNLTTGGMGPIFNANFANNIDEAESLVFWLSYTMDDIREPISFTKNGNDYTFAKAQKLFFNFDVRRLTDDDNDGFYSYKPAYAKDSHYVYFDSRSYNNTTVKYDAVLPGARPYFKSNGTDGSTNLFQPIADKTYQIICAGRDGEFGPVPTATPPRKDITFGSQNAPVNIILTGSSGERDNLTSFSEGKLLEQLAP